MIGLAKEFVWWVTAFRIVGPVFFLEANRPEPIFEDAGYALLAIDDIERHRYGNERCIPG